MTPRRLKVDFYCSVVGLQRVDADHDIYFDADPDPDSTSKLFLGFCVSFFLFLDQDPDFQFVYRDPI